MKFGILAVTILMIFYSCRKDNESTQSKKRDNLDGLKKEIKVGSRTIITDKYTSKGTPVVPMWNVAMPNFGEGKSFPELNQVEYARVWQPPTKDDGAYNHYACLIFYKGKYFAMWGNGYYGEDAPGQRVLFSQSTKWGEWPDAKELFPQPGPIKPTTESGIHLKPDRWVVVNENLYAIVYVHEAGRYPIARQVGIDGTLGEAFLVRELPSNGTLPEFMNTQTSLNSVVANQLLEWYSQNDQISWWAYSGEGIPAKGIDGSSLIECFTYRTQDKCRVLFMRNWGTPSNPVHNNRLYVSFNDGSGNWETPYPTDIPDSPSRAQALTIGSGTVLLIGNQIVNKLDQAEYLPRDPLTLSISNDGYSFNKTFTLRKDYPTDFLFTGVSGRTRGFGYPSSIVNKDTLYVLYSVSKEFMEIARVPLSAIEEK